jgi:hypothetical protein
MIELYRKTIAWDYCGGEVDEYHVDGYQIRTCQICGRSIVVTPYRNYRYRIQHYTRH